MSGSAKLLLAAALVGSATVVATVCAAETAAPALSADELAAQMNAASQGNALVRARLEVRSLDGDNKRVMQLEIKQRRTKERTDLVYRVLWPNERQGEAVILHQEAGQRPGGSVVQPSHSVRPIEASQMESGLFGSDLSYQDAVENFFGWEKQSIVGSAVINRVECQILESRPGSSDISIYAKVRSWIDPHRFVPLRVEKYSGAGDLIRRIDTTRVAQDQRHHPIPANLVVHGPRKNSVTELDGIRINQDVTFTDDDFSTADVQKK
jgi:Outer membrane lipoprotein-sorting protein